MDKNEIIEEIRKLLQHDTIGLSREDYREILEEISLDIDSSIEAMDEEDNIY